MTIYRTLILSFSFMFYARHRGTLHPCSAAAPRLTPALSQTGLDTHSACIKRPFKRKRLRECDPLQRSRRPLQPCHLVGAVAQHAEGATKRRDPGACRAARAGDDATIACARPAQLPDERDIGREIGREIARRWEGDRREIGGRSEGVIRQVAPQMAIRWRSDGNQMAIR